MVYFQIVGYKLDYFKSSPHPVQSLKKVEFGVLKQVEQFYMKENDLLVKKVIHQMYSGCFIRYS